MRYTVLALGLSLPMMVAGAAMAADPGDALQSAAAASASSPAGTAATPQADAAAQQAFQEMQQLFGTVPSMFKMIPAEAVPGAWAEMKGLQMNPHTALSGKDKELIGLAVAAQIPCDYCIYFHSMAAQKAGASQQEVQEAVSMAALTRHWSTILNGSQMDRQAFRQETDQMLAHVSQQAQVGSDKTPVDRKSSP